MYDMIIPLLSAHKEFATIINTVFVDHRPTRLNVVGVSCSIYLSENDRLGLLVYKLIYHSVIIIARRTENTFKCEIPNLGL